MQDAGRAVRDRPALRRHPRGGPPTVARTGEVPEIMGMSTTTDESSPGSINGAETRQRGATVSPVLPLALLRAMRAHDRPDEVLEDEDLTVSLPRRLGLTDVIETQIRRYEELGRRGVPVAEVVDLLRLVLRRPDADAILRDAGRQVARDYLQGVATATAAAARVLPTPARAATLRAATRRMLRRLVGRGALEVSSKPLTVRISDAITALAGVTGPACAFYASAIEELASAYTRVQKAAHHDRCAARGDDACEWILAD